MNPAPVSAAGVTYYVRATGGNNTNDGLSFNTAWATLSMLAGTTTFGPGDTIKLDGTFTNQSMSPAVNGTAALPITVTSYDPANPAVIDQGGSGTTAGTMIQFVGTTSGAWGCSAYREYWAITGLRFTNTDYQTETGPATSGLGLLCARGITISNNTIEKASISIRRSTGVLVEGNTISDVATSWGTLNGSPHIFLATGVAVHVYENSDSNTIIGNRITNCGHGCLEFGQGDSTADKSTGNRGAYNVISNPAATPVFLAVDAQYSLLENNIIQDASTSPAYQSCDTPAALENCVATQLLPRSGLYVRGNNFDVRGNLITGSTGACITINGFIGENNWVFTANNNRVYNNTCYNNAKQALYFQISYSTADQTAGLPVPTVSNNIVANNIFHTYGDGGTNLNGNTPSVWFEVTGVAPPWPADLSGNELRNNIFWRGAAYVGDEEYTVVRPGTFSDYTLRQFQRTYRNQAKDNIERDPLLVDPAGGDYRLQPNSIAISRGTPITGTPYSYAQPNIGAYGVRLSRMGLVSETPVMPFTDFPNWTSGEYALWVGALALVVSMLLFAVLVVIQVSEHRAKRAARRAAYEALAGARLASPPRQRSDHDTDGVF